MAGEREERIRLQEIGDARVLSVESAMLLATASSLPVIPSLLPHWFFANAREEGSEGFLLRAVLKVSWSSLNRLYISSTAEPEQ